MDSLVDPSVQSTVVSNLSVAAGAAQERRTSAYDQLSVNASSVWTSALANPTILGAEAIGMLNRMRNNPTPEIKT